jgi:hypothetical protein
MGWWGFPWGPIYTIEAIVTNAVGGRQPKRENAILLRTLGFLLYAEGAHVEAREALRASLRLEQNDQTSKLFDYLENTDTQAARWDYWRFASGLPATILTGLAVSGILISANRPTGYQARYQPPATIWQTDLPTAGGIPAHVAGPTASANTGVNALVEQLAELVAARAPVVGTHIEGTAQVTDHVLDRSKFDAQELYPIAQTIRSSIGTATGDADGFLASSYFNASLFASSVDIQNRMEQGQPIGTQVSAVRRLAEVPVVRRWLDRSKFSQPYTELLSRLKRYERGYKPGRSFAQLEAEGKSAKQRLADLQAQMERYKASGMVDAYNSLVTVHNALVEQFNRAARTLEYGSTAAQKLDLAFNRCLDPAILLGRFDRVDLTSHAAQIDAAPEPGPGTTQ